jgi:hypothetical protein
MNELNQETSVDTAEEERKAGARIALPVENMVRTKSASGSVSFHCGDAVAKALNGLSLPHVKTLATDALAIDVTKYDHLNPGQQRMTLGNVIRNMLRRDETLSADFSAVLARVQIANDEDSRDQREQAAAKKAEKELMKAQNEEARAQAKIEAEAIKVAKKEAREQAKIDRKAAREQAKLDKVANEAEGKAEAARIKAEAKAAKELALAEAKEAKAIAKAQAKADADETKALKAQEKAEAKAAAKLAADEAKAAAAKQQELI